MARKNFAVGSILTAPTTPTAGTTVVLTSGHGARFSTGKGFYKPANFNPLTDTAEEITISGIATDTLTIVRNTDSRGAASMAVGGIIYQGPTAGELDTLFALNVMTTAGDLITGGASGVPTRLAMGSSLQQLRVNSGATALEYATISGGGGILLTDDAQYYQLYVEASNITKITANFSGTMSYDTSEMSMLWTGGGAANTRGGFDIAPTNGYVDFNSFGDWFLQFMVRQNQGLDGMESWWGVTSSLALTNSGSATVFTTQIHTGVWGLVASGAKSFYATNGNGTATTQTLLASITNTNGLYNVFSIVKTTSNIKTYEHGNLKATQSSNMYTGSMSKMFRAQGASQANSGTCNFYVHFINYKGKMA